MASPRGYAVFLVDKAAEALGPAAASYVTAGGAEGDYLVATEVDTGGNFCEMTLEGTNKAGEKVDVSMMIPISMIRMIISVMRDDHMGFQIRPPATTSTAANPTPPEPGKPNLNY